MANTSRLIVAAVGLLLLSGCGYYRVIDPASNKEYITNDWQAGRYRANGAARFTDLRTGRDVTLPASEVEKISKEEAMRAIQKPVTPARSF
jgi:hypothetical protein